MGVVGMLIFIPIVSVVYALFREGGVSEAEEAADHAGGDRGGSEKRMHCRKDGRYIRSFFS